MKISASIYSNKHRNLEEVVRELDAHGVDLFHIDCNDDLGVFDDIERIRAVSTTPIDLHVITPDPEPYFEPIIRHQVDFVSFQYETLEKPLNVPTSVTSRLGLAIVSSTDMGVFKPFEERFEFILLMTTTPGQSGGVFDKSNFRRIRQLQRLYPSTRLHVDGGVNHEVSFILRNMGVYASVSGSYLMNNEYIGAALLNLKTHDVESHYLVRDFMQERDETPLVGPQQRDVRTVLQSIEDFRMGCTLLVDDAGVLDGMITNADMRRGLLRHMDDISKLTVDEMLNREPVVANENLTVTELLQLIKRQSFPVNYIPIVDDDNKATGIVCFWNLVKGEL